MICDLHQSLESACNRRLDLLKLGDIQLGHAVMVQLEINLLTFYTFPKMNRK